MPLLPPLIASWTPIGVIVGLLVLWAELRVFKIRLDKVDVDLKDINGKLDRLDGKLDRLIEALLTNKINCVDSLSFVTLGRPELRPYQRILLS